MTLSSLLMTVVLGSVAISQARAADLANLKVGIVFDRGGKDDRSFNAAAYRGAMECKDKLGATIKYVEATDDNAFIPLLRSLAQKDYDLVVSVGISQADALQKIASQFPSKKFAGIDSPTEGPNIRTILFEEHEASYLVGAIAALSSKTGSIGFIGGMDIPLIRRFQMGYEAGAKKAVPTIKIVSNFVGVSTESWNNPAKAKELAVSQYGSGADVIFAAAGASNAGLFDAAEETKKFAIGVDSNQNWIKPGFVLTSMLKRVDNAVFDACKDLKEGKFTAGVKRFGLASQGVDFAMDKFNEKLIAPAVLKKVEGLRHEIISGKIQVPDYYKRLK